jgi:hypothetical protein
MNDEEWTKHKFECLWAVLADRRMTRTAIAVAALLVTRYFLPKRRQAFAGVDTWAGDLDMNRRGVQRALDLLLDAKHLLLVHRGGRGFGDSNRYELPDSIPLQRRRRKGVNSDANANKGDKPSTLGRQSEHVRVTNRAIKGVTRVTKQREQETTRGTERRRAFGALSLALRGLRVFWLR